MTLKWAGACTSSSQGKPRARKHPRRGSFCVEPCRDRTRSRVHEKSDRNRSRTAQTARAGTDKGLLSNFYQNLAAYLVAEGDLPGAFEAAREGIKIRAAQEPGHVYVGIGIEHLSLVYALRGDLARAATLEGYADSVFQKAGFKREFTEMTTHNRLTELLREGCTPDELARRFAEGAVLTPEAAIALALEQS